MFDKIPNGKIKIFNNMIYFIINSFNIKHYLHQLDTKSCNLNIIYLIISHTNTADCNQA